MANNPLMTLLDFGQSVWLDYIRRDMLESGELTDLINNDGLMGMTTNPSIFANAVAEGDLYDKDILAALPTTQDPLALFEAIAVKDVQLAADQFRGVFDKTKGVDGYVSIEVSPTLAYDAEGTIREARRLWASCDRPNIMVKIPGTKPGLKAIEQCLYEGININVTLLFSVERHRETMNVYLSALERRLTEGKSLSNVASVASFFISRVDSLIDKKLDALPQGSKAKSLRSVMGINNAKAAYHAFEAAFGGARFAALAQGGARVQRPLWASTSTKDARLSDVLYVDSLIGPNTVNTIPPKTYDAFRDHGAPANRITDDIDAALASFGVLNDDGVDFAAAMAHLEKEGVAKFADAFEGLLATIQKKATKLT